MTANKITMQRLAFVKYLYEAGVHQSKKAEPLCALSVLTFHDAIELFLRISSEHLDISRGQQEPSFMEYWDLINQGLQEKHMKGELTQKESMRRLNKARVSLKHHGTMPSKLDIEAFRSSTTDFFESNTPTIFGTDFRSISLIQVIRSEEVRNSLSKAENLIADGRTRDALVKVAVAFAQVFEEYENRIEKQLGTAFPFDSRIRTASRAEIGWSRLDGNMADFIREVDESICDLRESVRVLSTGIDYRKYARFRSIAPRAYPSDKGYLIAEPVIETEVPPSEDDVRFCIDFVIECAIALQEYDLESE